MSVTRLMGVETEYALTVIGRDGWPLPLENWVGRFMATARKELVSLRGTGSRCMFLGNGGRFYLDHGMHPELCTPECPTPWDVVRYVNAGDRMLRQVAAQFEADYPEVLEARIFRGNADYSGSGATWGCHESYMHRADSAELADQIIPHLISRIVYAGAGGFDVFDPGIRFTLSARAPYLARVVSHNSTGERGIFHTKNEPLCRNGYRRLHLLCGDSLRSHRALALTLGSTALVVWMIERGLRPGDGLKPRAPLSALRRFAYDVDCNAEIRLPGAKWTAVAIQRRYLEQVEERLGEEGMPDWAEGICRLWRETLDVLERGPREVEKSLDWAIKLALYRDRVARSDVDWELLPHWSSSLRKRIKALEWTGRLAESPHIAGVAGRRGASATPAGDLSPHLKDKGLSWKDFEAVLALRQELFEIDTRFAQLGRAGIFWSLDAVGVLSHELPAVDRIGDATSHPPEVGRARLRGEVVRRLSQRAIECHCGWDSVWDYSTHRVLDLADPFETQERWERADPDEGFELPPRRPRRPVRHDVISYLESMGL